MVFFFITVKYVFVSICVFACQLIYVWLFVSVFTYVFVLVCVFFLLIKFGLADDISFLNC